MQRLQKFLRSPQGQRVIDQGRLDEQVPHAREVIGTELIRDQEDDELGSRDLSVLGLCRGCGLASAFFGAGAVVHRGR